MQTFNQLKKNLNKDYTDLKKMKVAVLGDSATQFLNQAIRGSGFESGIDLEVYEADFNQIERQVFDSSSELYAFAPDIIIIFFCSHKLLSKYNKLLADDEERLADEQMELVGKITNTISGQTNAKILYYNYSEIDDNIFCNYAGKISSSFLFQLRKLNYELMLFAARYANFFIVDISSIQNRVGKSAFFQSSVYINTEMVLSIEALPMVANKTLDLISALILNIGFDSMVFLDDNPFERNMVRENIAGITVPELPEDPAEYLEFLYTLDLFETTSFSSGDAERTKQYQVEAERTVLQKTFTNEADFLKNLHMVSVVEPFNKFNTPRVAQLSQRSNQFNLRTVRFTESDIERLVSEPESFSFTFTLEDRFGDNGMICVIVLKKENDTILFIDTWLMSCRVLKRGMEQFVLNSIVGFAKKEGYSFLKGEYIETAKNAMVKNHYPSLGFAASGNYWLLSVDFYNSGESFIKNK